MASWTKTETESAISLFHKGLSYTEISKELNRTGKSIKEKLNRQGLFWGIAHPVIKGNCIECGTKLIRGQYSFCSHSCSSKHNNRKRKIHVFCIECHNEIKTKHGRTSQKFCSKKCESVYFHKIRIKSWLVGDSKGWNGRTRKLSAAIRRYLFNKYGTKCMRCGWDEKHPIDHKSLTEVNHIDGDAENCIESNLEILCPNCHSMTPNFRSRNKKSKRIRNRPFSSEEEHLAYIQRVDVS